MFVILALIKVFVLWYQFTLFSEIQNAMKKNMLVTRMKVIRKGSGQARISSGLSALTPYS